MFRAAFDRSGVAKAQAHPATGHFLRVNPKFRELTGYSEDELQRRTFLDITHPDDRDHPRWPFIAWSAARRPNIPRASATCARTARSSGSRSTPR